MGPKLLLQFPHTLKTIQDQKMVLVMNYTLTGHIAELSRSHSNWSKTPNIYGRRRKRTKLSGALGIPRAAELQTKPVPTELCLMDPDSWAPDNRKVATLKV